MLHDIRDIVRKNLEKIIELRNTSTHFILKEYEELYVPLFQASVINYSNKIKEYLNEDIGEHTLRIFNINAKIRGWCRRKN